MARRARLVVLTLPLYLMLITALSMVLIFTVSADADAHTRTSRSGKRGQVIPTPSPTEGVDLINGPSDNPRDRHGWYGGRFAIPDYIILTCENRAGDYTLKIGGYHPERRTASGTYMITKGTWNWFAGYREAYLAPPYLQDQKAALLWAGGAGKTHWSSCL